MVFIQVISSGHCWNEREKQGAVPARLANAAVLISSKAASARGGLPALSQQVRLAAATRYLGRSYTALQAPRAASATRILVATLWGS